MPAESRLDSLEVKHVRYFLVAAESGSFRKASKLLGVRESVVSRRICDFENRVNAKLFRRASSGVTLTAAGRRLLCTAQQIMRQLNDGARDASTIGKTEENILRIGIAGSTAVGFIANVLSDFVETTKGYQIRLIEAMSSELVTCVRQGEIDVAFVVAMQDSVDCDIKQLWSEQIYVATSRNHALSKMKALEWSDISDEVLLASDLTPTQDLNHYVKNCASFLGFLPNFSYHRVSRTGLLPLVALGQGISLLSEVDVTTTSRELEYIPITGARIGYKAIWRPSNGQLASRLLGPRSLFHTR